MNIDLTRKELTLSPEVRTALRLPLHAEGHTIRDSAGAWICDIDHFYSDTVDGEFADFIVALVNAALTKD